MVVTGLLPLAILVIAMLKSNGFWLFFTFDQVTFSVIGAPLGLHLPCYRRCFIDLCVTSYACVFMLRALRQLHGDKVSACPRCHHETMPWLAPPGAFLGGDVRHFLVNYNDCLSGWLASLDEPEWLQDGPRWPQDGLKVSRWPLH